MDEQQKTFKTFSRRMLIVMGIKCVLFSGLVARLFYLQVFRRDQYTILAEDNRINIKLIAPERGQIFDRFNVPLASNKQNFQLLIIPEQIKDGEQTLKSLARIIALSKEDRDKIMKRMRRRSKFLPITVATTLSWEQVTEIEVNLPHLPGVIVEEGKRRYYPLNEATAHMIGYVGKVSDKELTGEPILTLPGFQIGKTGIEKYYEKILQGFVGRTSEEVNAAGRRVRELSRQKSELGKDIQLTIDAELQIFTQNRLQKERSASAIIMDVHNGEVYAMTSSPAFDPNIFTQSLPQDLWDDLINDPAKPLTNKVISGQYPPGSTFKMITILAALEAGVTPNFKTFCPGHLDLGNHRFHCWKPSGHGWCGYTKSLEQSCDVFFYEIAQEVGIEKIAEMARRLGLGRELGMDIPGEKPGLIPDKQWKRRRYNKDWQVGETVIASIGQGYIQTTPVQLVTMMARLVNGGYDVAPYLVRSIDSVMKKQPKFKSLNFNPSHIDLIKKGMVDAVNKPKGTAFQARIKEKGFKMAGKTGTAQVRRISMEERRRGVKMEDLPWKFQHHALFVGYAPYDHPRFATAVVVEHGGSGSSAAAPIARDLLIKTQERLLNI